MLLAMSIEEREAHLAALSLSKEQRALTEGEMLAAMSAAQREEFLYRLSAYQRTVTEGAMIFFLSPEERAKHLAILPAQQRRRPVLRPARQLLRPLHLRLP